MNTRFKRYEIRTLQGMYWQVESRGGDKGGALASANGLAANSSIEGVIVVEEYFDNSKGRYDERTIFSFSRLEDEKYCNFSATNSGRAFMGPRPLTPEPLSDTQSFTGFAQLSAH